MRVLYAWNKQRGAGGSNRATERTIDLAEQNGIEVANFCRDSKDLAPGLSGRLQAAAGAIYPRHNVREFEHLLDRFRPDLVHAYELFPLISPWILPLCSQRGVPVVMNCDDYHLTCPVRTHVLNGKVCTQCVDGNEMRAVRNNCRESIAESTVMALYNAMTRQLGLVRNNVSHYIVLSPFARDWFVRHAGIAVEQTTLVPPIVGSPEQPADPGSGSYVGFAGRFVAVKGTETLLAAARSTNLPFRFSLIDDVPLPPDLDHVSLDHGSVSEFYRGARMVVVPSVWFETFGLVAAEAMSHGIPVIVSNIGALSSLIQDGVDGVYVEPGNATDLSEKIVRLWNDPALCRQIGAAAFAHAKENWTVNHHWDALMGVYERVATRSAKAPKDSCSAKTS